VVSASPRSGARGDRARRLAFWALLCSALAVPPVSSNAFEFPALAHPWALVPFAFLMVLPVADLRRPWRRINLDLAMLLLPSLAVAFEKVPRQWPVILAYVSLGYLALRMISVARPARSLAARHSSADAGIPRAWLVIGIAVLAIVHISWATQSAVSSDVGEGGVNGALRIVHGQSLYGREAVTVERVAQHTDTYGPFNYEAYVPAALELSKKRAALLTTLFFDLLSAVLLFALGRRIRDTRMGIVLAYCWLAFPMTLYEDALGFNDSIVAAALVATVLLAQHPARRGAVAAVAVWSKLSPLALLPLLATYQVPGRDPVRRFLAFAGAFAAATALIFVPALTHGTVATFVSRTVGFQAGREPSHSLWSTVAFSYGAHVAWLKAVVGVAHGLLAAIVGAFVVLSYRMSYRQDQTGLAAMSAAILIAIQLLLSYYSYSYVLWFAPLVLVALLTESPAPSTSGRALARPHEQHPTDPSAPYSAPVLPEAHAVHVPIAG
jgi:hypothetical protein